MRAATDLAAFDRTTGRWGPVTLALSGLLSLGAMLWVAFGSGVGITGSEFWTAAGAVLAAFAIIGVIEPIAYYPVLGRSAMYQAFMIGNIANRLLPAALTAQERLGEKAGTRRAELIAGSAFVGAFVVHIVTLVVFVGFAGNWLVGALPPVVISVAQDYILPAIFGAVLVQAALSQRTPRVTVIAAAVGVVVTFVLVPLVPAAATFGSAIAVVATILLAWFLRDRRGEKADA